ncbi:MAG: adenylate/guanylate cyclase domain-containing protein [Candidatus Binatia bacterium]
MTFDEVLDQIRVLLQQRGRLTYGAIKRRFDLDEAYLADIKDELIEAEQVARDENGKVLVWTGDETSRATASQTVEASVADGLSSALSPQPQRMEPTGERRQLTVMFCDLVGSTALSEQLDPEELQTVVQTYQTISAQVIERYDGYIAQYLGDGLLVYFGYPAAHEDDAARAIRAGLEIVEAMQKWVPSPLVGEGQGEGATGRPLQVRIGVHTGPVVIGEIGSSTKRELLALGETPNIAARVQGEAQPNTVVMSAATARLVQGLFECQNLGFHTLKGISTPLLLYHVVGESTAQSRFAVAVRSGLTPLVGRESELGVLHERWTQATAGHGHVVLLNGEPGIGKSRLVEELKARIPDDGARQIEFRCSPYHQNSAFYPIIEHLQRRLQFMPDDTPETKLGKLQQMLGRYRFPQATTLPLLAALLSLPHPTGVPPLSLSPQKQKELTQATLVAWLIEKSEQTPIYTAWEDLHWADPSTLELLDLFLPQVPTTRILVLLTFRPEFVPPWGTRSYLSHLTLRRLDPSQVPAMVARVTGGKALPNEVVEQIVTKTDGVPLFVEELIKMVVESNLVHEVNGHYELTGPLLPLAIPSTLQDSLMARLDRFAPVKEVAQLGATLGREFSYELIRAVSPLADESLQEGLRQLVDAELVYQRGLPPQARYLFKHALIQDTAYQSLLKSKRQQLHQQIAQVLEQQFPETVETQPELIAHHYTEAVLVVQAIPYWQKAGQRASRRSANVEAISHLTRGLELLKTLPDMPEHAQQELGLQIILGPALVAIKGFGAPEVEQTYTRARELCRQLGETPQLFPVLRGLQAFYVVREQYKTARELGEQLLSVAQRVQDPVFLLMAHNALGGTFFSTGEFTSARGHLEQSIALYDPQQHNPQAAYTPHDLGVVSLSFMAWTLWHLGYPTQALTRSAEAVSLAQELSHPFSLDYALQTGALVHQLRREKQNVQEHTAALIARFEEQKLPYFLAIGTILQGWALAEQGQGEDGIEHIRQGLADLRASL